MASRLAGRGVASGVRAQTFDVYHASPLPLVRARNMHIAILTFEGFNELDSLIALGVLNRVKKPDWRVSIACPAARVRSMNGVVIEAQASLEEASAADAVIVGSGMQTREVVADEALMARLRVDPSRQLLAAQCSGTLVLAKLGLLDGVPACTDLTTKPWVQEAGIEVLNQPFFARGNVATAGGCLASHYLAAWIIARLEEVEAAESALHYVAPVGEKEEYVARAMRNIRPYLQDDRRSGRAASVVS
jgi:transcriptional regulator GlxA family with amidase domain